MRLNRPTVVAAVAAGALGIAAGFGLAGFGGSGSGHPASATAVPPTSPTSAQDQPVTSPTSTDPGSGSTHKKHGGSIQPTTAAPPDVAVPAGLPSLSCPSATVTVHDATGLQAALDAARPGTVISMADGVYAGRFTARGAGSSSAPIWLCGTRMAILDDAGDSPSSAPAQGSGNYGLHLLDASWWRLVGFSVRNAQKGVVLDHTTNSVLHGLTVYHIGDEAIHLREFSSDNTVEGCVVRDTGLRVTKYGEGIYLGTAVHNWGSYTGGQPDTSDRNVVRYNDISATTAENIDVKEGTTGGEIAFNHLDGTGMVSSASTSWVNVKGNGYQVHDNTGEVSLGDGFSTHRIVDGAGTGNTFANNHIGAGVAGYGFAIHSDGNTVACDNTGQGQKGQANVSCTP